MDHHARESSSSDQEEGATEQGGRGARSMTGTVTVHYPHLASGARLHNQLTLYLVVPLPSEHTLRGGLVGQARNQVVTRRMQRITKLVMAIRATTGRRAGGKAKGTNTAESRPAGNTMMTPKIIA